MDSIIENHDGDNSVMEQDDPALENEILQATQSQPIMSQPVPVVDDHLWGFLQPCSPALCRIDLLKLERECDIGRNPEGNKIVLPGFKVSNKHCRIVWDGRESADSTVTIQDFSSNGTFVNGVKVGKGRTRIIRDGNELGFGTAMVQDYKEGIEDYRYVFRLAAAACAMDGIYAHYDIGNELGKGSFASVYKAMHRQSSKWYAVKMIQADKIKRHPATQGVLGDPAKATAFAREISILEQLSHPNICQLKETFFHDNSISLVLELVEGGDLLEYILKNGGVDEPAAKHITYQICDALAYIHDKGIAHRDLKPENVLLTKDDPPIVKVADFGLAKVVDSLTVLRTMCGTPSYLAPEVVMQVNKEGYSHLVDSWSVGVIVFSMLTNTSPFIENEANPDIRTRVAERRVDWVALCRADISAHGQSFIRRLLDPRPDFRMTLAAARNHPWLYGYGPVQTHAPPQQPSIGSNVHEDQSMITHDDVNGMENGASDQINRDFEQMQLQQNGGGNNGLPRREGSRILSRRSQIISQAAEDEAGGGLPEPSWQMISNSEAMDNAAAENTAAGPSTRGHKRKDHSISGMAPMPENEEWKGPAIDGGAGPRKKGRGASRSVRGTRAKAAGNASDEEPAQAVRRSTRQTPQKPTRKN